MVKHQPVLRAPWYADASDGTLLHRYMQDDFVETFIAQCNQNQLKANRNQEWIAQDKFGGQHTRLRLPLQRAFYMVATEVVCDFPWQPAFAPQKIIASGFVVRKKNATNLHIWRLRNGKALGWQQPNALDLTQDPDLARRNALNPALKIRGIKPLANTATGFSGEQTYPLHHRVVNTDKGPRTLLFGYLPLNGQREQDEVIAENSAAQEVSAAGYLAELEWPFGSWDGNNDGVTTCTCSGSVQEVIQKLCDKFQWSANLQLQINNGIPTRAFGRLLTLLVNRYQVMDQSIADNQDLRELLLTMPIVVRALSAHEQNLMQQNPNEFMRQMRALNIVRGSLWDYLSAQGDAVSTWCSAHELFMAQDNPPPFAPLKNFNGYLYISESMAQAWRAQMLARAEQISSLVEAALPLPRYTQGKDETYFVQPFMRYRDECDCEKICWGQPSFEFTVASPFDTQTARPSVIQLPELRDITKGMAKGVTFLTPKSVANLMLKVAPTMEMKEQQSRSPLDACLGFSISFSIPIITICAMILLMIVLNLLNLIFRWLPYAILILPRLCLPRVNVNSDN